MPLTPEDVQNKRFTTTRFRPGYDEDEVDAFLDEVEAELTRLLQENKTLAARATAVVNAPPAAPAPVAPPPPPEPTPEPEGQDAALRTLLLAQRTADEAIAQARKEAEQIVTDARTRASELEQEAQQRHATAMAELERRRRDLERQVDDLRAFEREYRTRLKAYLETQLRELAGRGLGADGPAPSTPAAPPTTPPATPQSPPPTARAEGAGPAIPALAPPSPPTSASSPAAPAPPQRSTSPFGPAPTFGRPGQETGETSEPATPTAPPREADAPSTIEVDEGPEVPPPTG
jgi:DivIVA domain-containing protein